MGIRFRDGDVCNWIYPPPIYLIHLESTGRRLCIGGFGSGHVSHPSETDRHVSRSWAGQKVITTYAPSASLSLDEVGDASSRTKGFRGLEDGERGRYAESNLRRWLSLQLLSLVARVTLQAGRALNAHHPQSRRSVCRHFSRSHGVQGRRGVSSATIRIRTVATRVGC